MSRTLEPKVLKIAAGTRAGSTSVTIGARDPEVEEPPSGAKSVLFEFELNEVVEPKGLRPIDLIKLIEKFGSDQHAAAAIGCCEAFVRQNVKRPRP